MSETDGRSPTERETDAEAETETALTHLLDRFEPLLLVAIGGFAGAVLRHAVAVALSATVALPDGLPWGTLAVNVAGSFALGVLLYEATLTGQFGPRTRLVFGTGFLSSFTTYSTFAAQTAVLSPMLAVANVGANYTLGFAAVMTGRFAVRSLATPEVTG